jgi:hypothetical protein
MNLSDTELFTQSAQSQKTIHQHISNKGTKQSSLSSELYTAIAGLSNQVNMSVKCWQGRILKCRKRQKNKYKYPLRGSPATEW